MGVFIPISKLVMMTTGLGFRYQQEEKCAVRIVKVKTQKLSIQPTIPKGVSGGEESAKIASRGFQPTSVPFSLLH
jgi:hypothetical protein